MDVRLVFRQLFAYLSQILVIIIAYLFVNWILIHPISSLLDVDQSILLAFWGVAFVLLFQPIRRYIDDVTDKIFFRKAVNYSEFQQRLGQEMSELIDLTQLGKMVQRELTETFHVKDVLLLVRMKNDFDHFTLVPPAKRGQRKLELEANDPFLRPFQTQQDVLVTEELKRQIQDNQFKGDLEEMNRILDQLHEWSVDLVVPLRAKRELIGLLLLGEKKSGDVFTSSDIKFFQLLSPQLATAVERNKLYHQLEAHVEELVALHDFGRQMTASLDLTQTLNVIIDSVMRITGVDRALLYLLNDTNTQLHAMIGRGDDPKLYKDLVVPIDQTSLKYVIEQKKPLVVEDAAKDPRVNKEIAARLQTTSFIAVPLMTKDGVIGVIGVDNKKSGRSLRMVDVDVLSTLASQAATAISNDRLYEKVQNFNKDLQVRVDDATAHLKELLKMKSDFLTIASHQLRTPTSIVRGMLSMLFEDAKVLSAEEKEKFISDAYEGINRLEQIINDLLNATELEGKKIRMELSDVQLEDMAADIFKEFEPLAKSQKISLVYHAPAQKTLKVKTDVIRLREAVKNIIANAIYYTPKGYVEIEIGKKDNQAFICVKDTGIGITEPDRRKLFKKFSRGDGVQQIHPNGSGLGLFIAKRVVDALGGKITVESEGRNKGSVFTIWLPA
ncbi:MAG: GAF domain-containing protein [Patescibacteria group bacterium]